MRAQHILAAMLAAAAPYSAGMPALDTGRRDARLGPRVVVEGDPPRPPTWRQPEVEREVPGYVQRELVERAKAKRARRASRGW